MWKNVKKRGFKIHYNVKTRYKGFWGHVFWHCFGFTFVKPDFWGLAKNWLHFCAPRISKLQKKYILSRFVAKSMDCVPKKSNKCCHMVPLKKLLCIRASYCKLCDKRLVDCIRFGLHQRITMGRIILSSDWKQSRWHCYRIVRF